jgi:hypothetical protein
MGLTTESGEIITSLWTYDGYESNYIDLDFLAAGNYVIGVRHQYSGNVAFKEFTVKTFS